MDLEFAGEVWYWRGPSPFHFVTVPAAQSARINEVASLVSYGWGMIPVRARIGGTQWETSLFPKDGAYLVPIKDKIRKAEQIDVGDEVKVWLGVNVELR